MLVASPRSRVGTMPVSPMSPGHRDDTSNVIATAIDSVDRRNDVSSPKWWWACSALCCSQQTSIAVDQENSTEVIPLPEAVPMAASYTNYSGDHEEYTQPPHTMPSLRDNAAEEEVMEANTFSFTAERGEGFGMILEMWPGIIQIVGLSSGSIQKYNDAAPENKRVFLHDFITQVNGVSSVQDMIFKLKRERVLSFHVRRPVRKHVTILAETPDMPWGIKMNYLLGGSSCLQVVDLGPGSAQAHNKRVAMDQRLIKGDFVESVNGVSGSSDRILDEVRKAKRLEIVYLRLVDSDEDEGPRTCV